MEQCLPLHPLQSSNMFTKEFIIPAKLADDITAIIAYQNTQLIQLICKEKGWDRQELMNYFYK